MNINAFVKKVNKHVSTFRLLHKKMICLFLSVLFLSVIMANHVFANSGLVTTSNDYVSQSPYQNLCWAACGSRLWLVLS